jgi:hypothetical protein
MTKNKIKIGMGVLLLSVVAGTASYTPAYPPFLPKAQKFGAKDCSFCHTTKEGGGALNARGKWLLAEKSKRGASAVDPAWLADYKKKGK